MYVLFHPRDGRERDFHAQRFASHRCPPGFRESFQEEIVAQGFSVGRSKISLTKDCGDCVTSISTTWATSSGCSIFPGSLPTCGLNSVCVDPGQMTDTLMLCARNSSATE